MLGWCALGAVALSCIEGTLLSSDLGIDFWSVRVFRATSLAVVPNFIAGLIAYVFAYFTLRQDDRGRYVKAMRKVRHTLYELRKINEIEPKHAQAVRSFRQSPIYILNSPGLIPMMTIVPPRSRNACCAPNRS